MQATDVNTVSTLTTLSKTAKLSGYKEVFAHFGYKETTELNLTEPILFLRSNIQIYTSEHLIVFASIQRNRIERERDRQTNIFLLY